jgi:hydrogenase maturation protein HypF
MAFDGAELDWRPSVRAAIAARQAGASPDEIALAFHLALAEGVAAAAGALAVRHRVRTVVLSGGVFQNALLAEEASGRLGARGLRVLMSSRVPPNDGGVSLGQAALVSVSQWRC